MGVLAGEHFHRFTGSFDRRPLIRAANSLGGHPMQLIHWRRLVELGRLPDIDEGRTEDAITGIDSFGAGIVEVFMVSHRWLRPSRDRRSGHPDGPGGEKAAALNQFSAWRREWVRWRHGFLPEIFYWIDYCCMDQARAEVAVAMLPLWVACCERFVRIETEDYEERAWCRVEPLLSYVFSFADHHLSIGLDFRSAWPNRGTEDRATILDPRSGKLTVSGDVKLIRRLTKGATASSPLGEGRRRVKLGRSTIKCYRL